MDRFRRRNEDGTMHDSYLIQRLEKPRNYGMLGLKDNPFSFGGGLVNGGLSPDAMDLLRGIFEFDYMGAAEFEWGAVPAAFGAIAEDAGNMVAFSFTIPLKEIPKDFRDDSEQDIPGDGTVYVMAPERWQSEIIGRIKEFAVKGYKVHLKEPVHLDRALRPIPNDRYPRDICGWLELENGFMFFTDKEMWEQTCELFGVTTA